MKLRHIIYFLMLILPSVVMAQEATDTPDGGLPRSDTGQILFWRAGDIFVVDADGNNERNLTETLDDISDATWMPDGTQIVFYYRSSQNDLYLMQADGSHVNLLVQINQTGMRTSQLLPSPDGRYILWQGVTLASNDYTNHFVLVDVNTGDTQTIEDAYSAYYRTASWSPDGSEIAFKIYNDGWNIHIYDVELANIRYMLSGLIPAWSPDGTSLIVPRPMQTPNFTALDLVPLEGNQVHRLTEQHGTIGAIQWSPDGQYIAFILHRTGLHDSVMKIIDLESGEINIMNPTYIQGVFYTLAWSPDSQRLALLASITRSSSSIYIANIDGRHFTLLENGPIFQTGAPHWRP
jgi:Tol biopolymer transport system component